MGVGESEDSVRGYVGDASHELSAVGSGVGVKSVATPKHGAIDVVEWVELLGCVIVIKDR